MTPMTPLVDTPNGRLAELITMLIDTPLHLAFDAVALSDTFSPSQPADPWWIVASAVVRLRNAETTKAETPAGDKQEVLRSDRAREFDDLVTSASFSADEEVLPEVLSGLIDLATV